MTYGEQVNLKLYVRRRIGHMPNSRQVSFRNYTYDLGHGILPR